MKTKTFLSTDEFERLPEPEQGGGYELDEGEPVYVSPNSLEQAEINYRNADALLKEWAKSDDRGLVAADLAIPLAPGAIRAPDVAFIPRGRIINLDPEHTP